MNAKPIHEVRLGCIKAAVWRNQTETGVRHNVTFRRLYKDGAQWKSSDSFGRDDLLLLAKVADRTHSWILERNQESETGTSSRAPQPPDAPGEGSAPGRREQTNPPATPA
jgi:hypothetical protein